MLIKLLKRLVPIAARRDARTRSTALCGEPRTSRFELIEEAGRLHARADLPALIELSRKGLLQYPGDADLLQFLASAYLARGETAQAIGALQQAVARSPAPWNLHLSLARLLAGSERQSEADEQYAHACGHEQTAAIASKERASLLNQLGRYDEAERCARAFLAREDGSVPHRHELASALFEQGRVDEALEVLGPICSQTNADPRLHSDFLRALNYTDSVSAAEAFRAHKIWGERHADPLNVTTMPFANTRDADRVLRVGFVSPHFRKHAVTFFLESVLAHIRPDQIEVTLYSDARREDEYSARLRRSVNRWHGTAQLSDDALAGLVREDGIDVLIDLTGHTPGHRLLTFARRAAPVQMTWNGYPNTTGMSAMDYRLTDAHCDPPGSTEHLHTERLLRLPEIFMSWQVPADAPEPGPIPAIHNGHITYGSFNGCYKLTETTLQLWSDLLERDERARLVLAAMPDGNARLRVSRAFERRGIDPGRVEFRGRVGHEAFLDLHRDVDIALDPFPYHGTTTTCFSLWMGVPVITLLGDSHASRVGGTLLAGAGLPELIAHDADEYVQIACALGADIGALTSLRAGLRKRLSASALTDGYACARALHVACRQAWMDWCEHG